MKLSHVLFISAVMAVIMLIPTKSSAEYLTIRMPAYSDGLHEYYYDLLATALERDGHLAAIEQIEDFPHLRERAMLENGELSIMWLIRSEERDKLYLPVPVNLTNGLIGQRILFVAPDNINNYKDVKTLGDFRRLGKMGGFGKGWFDVGVWDANHLPYKEMAEWRLLYDMVADGTRGVDYFSRGFNEIGIEAKNHPELAIEPNLMLVYDRDFIFYVSPKMPQLVPIIESALIKAKESGLMGELIKKHWAENYDLIQPDKRTIIKLKNPK